MQSPAHGKENLYPCWDRSSAYRLGAACLATISAEKALGVMMCRQHEPAVCPDGKRGQQHPGLYEQKHSQYIEGSDYPTVLSIH